MVPKAYIYLKCLKTSVRLNMELMALLFIFITT